MTDGAHTRHAPAPLDGEAAAVADRIAALLATHPLPTAIAIAICERGAVAEPMYVGWKQAGISRRVWQRLVSSGELPAVRIGRAHMARPADVRACMERNRVRPRPKARPAAGIPATSNADLDALLASGAVHEAAE